MPQVQILRRDRVARALGPGQLVDAVSVLYVTGARGPTIVYRPEDDYRDATKEELIENRRLTVRPVGPDAARPETLELP